MMKKYVGRNEKLPVAGCGLPSDKVFLDYYRLVLYNENDTIGWKGWGECEKSVFDRAELYFVCHNDTVYSDFRWQSRLFYQYFPLQYSNDVSRLTIDDISAIAAEDVSRLDFIDELPDSVLLKINGQLSRSQDLSEFKALGSVEGAIRKITVRVKEERLSQIAGTADDTALMRAVGIDIRAYTGMYDYEDSIEGYECRSALSDITDNCVIAYYFLVTDGGGEPAYTPLAAVYRTEIKVERRVAFQDESVLLENNPPTEVARGTVDQTQTHTVVEYYIFN